FGIENWHLLAVAQFRQVLRQQTPHEQLFLDPHWHCRQKAGEAAGSEGVIGLEQPLELQERLVVKSNRRQVLEVDARLLQNVPAGVNRERGVVLLAGEALFLRGSHNLAVKQQRRGAIVVVR